MRARDHFPLPLLDEESLLHTAAELRPVPQARPFEHTGSLIYFNKYSRTSIPHRQPRPPELCGFTCSLRTPRTPLLCRLLAVFIALLVCVHAVSCGLFFWVTIPLARHHHVDLGDLFADAATLQPMLQPTQPQLSAPKLIPRIIHQTFRSRKLPASARQVMRSWREHNGEGWHMRFYDDPACLEFVRSEFPEYLEAYLNLPKDVERSDFFRYMVILRLGGVYADIDVECRQPLDTVIRATDTMVVGWEAEVASDAAAFRRHFVRKRQVLQWFFAAAAGHPALREICDHIARHALTTFSANANRDTLERTGPGIWTDIVLKHAMLHPAVKVDDPWKVRILPRVAFGVHPAGIDGLTPDAPEIVVLHHFLGSWKVKGGWYKRKPVLQRAREILAPVIPWLRSKAAELPEEPIRSSGVRHYPVSVAFEPPFTMMVDLVGHGDRQSGSDVSNVVSLWGMWQPGLSPSRKPAVVEALIGALGVRGRPQQREKLVDVGAGHGFYSLAAAARGHDVLAVELSTRSVRALQASIEYNGWQGRVQLAQVALGAAAGATCLQRAGPAVADADAASVHMRRGYGNLDAHRIALQPAALSGSAAAGGAAGSTAAAAAVGSANGCAVAANRTTLTQLLGNDTTVGAIRISANGHEGWIVDGAMGYLRRHKPDVVYLEFAPLLMQKAGYIDPLRLLRQLYDLGYSDVAHSGYVCDERWYNITNVVRAKGSFGPAAQTALLQPTWCKLRPAHFHLLMDHAHDEVPENLLFIYRDPTAAAGGGATVNGTGINGTSVNGTTGGASSRSRSPGGGVIAGASAGGSIPQGQKAAAHQPQHPQGARPAVVDATGRVLSSATAVTAAATAGRPGDGDAAAAAAAAMLQPAAKEQQQRQQHLLAVLDIHNTQLVGTHETQQAAVASLASIQEVRIGNRAADDAGVAADGAEPDTQQSTATTAVAHAA